MHVGAVDPHRCGADRRHVALHDRLGVRLVQLAQVAEDERRPRRGRSGEHVLRPVDTGENERRGDAGGLSPGDVGVESVADEQRMPRPEACHRLIEDGPLGLAGDDGEASHRGVHGGDEGSVSRGDPPRLRDRPVGVRGDPGDPALVFGEGESVGGFGELQPADVLREALHDGGGDVVSAPRDAISRLLELVDEAVTADDEHRGTGFHALAQEPHRGLRARDDVVGLGRREAEFAEVLGDGTVAPRSVVGDVPESASVGRPGEAFHGVGQRAGACVHHAVEVGEDRVHPVEGRPFGATREQAHQRVDSASGASPAASSVPASARISSTSS